MPNITTNHAITYTNNQTVHIYNEIQYKDTELYIYTLKLQIHVQIYRTAFIQIEITHMYIVPHACTPNHVHVRRSYTFINLREEALRSSQI